MEELNVTTKVVDPALQSTAPLKNKLGSSMTQYGSVYDDDVPLIGKDEPTSRIQRIKTLTIEPVVFLFIFGFVLDMSCLSNMMIDKGCRYHFNYTEEICRNLSGHPTEKENVEILANNYGLYSNLMSLIAAFQMVFLASWSDKYGRRFPLMLSIFGIAVSDVCLLLCAIFFESQLFYLILAKIPSEIFGGIICMFTIVFSHASEVSSEKYRPLKYMTVEISLGLGMALGGVTGGMMFKYYGYVYVFITATAAHLLSLTWLMIFVKETTGLQVTKRWREKLKDLYRFDSLTSSFKASFRKRENYGRELLILFFISMSFMVLSYESFGSIGFIYVHHIYNWDQGTYTIINTIFNITQMLVLVLFIPLMLKVFKVTNATLGLIGVISMTAKFAIIAFAKFQVYIYYIGNVAGFLSSLLSLSIRTEVSKIVDKDELGLVFSFFATVEAIVPLFGTILITKVFNATMDIYPSVSYLMTAIMMVVPLGTFTWACIKSRKIKEIPSATVN